MFTLADIRFALRTFRRAPSFASTVVVTLAAGIAAVTLVVAIVNAVLYAKFDVYRDPKRLVYVLESNVQLGTNGGVSTRTLSDWRAAPSLERLAGVEPGSATLVSAGKEAQSVMRGAITDGLLALLDARPAAGRLFSATDYTNPAAPVALLSYSLWRDRHGLDPAAIGSTISIDGRPVTIIGVLAPPFTLAPFVGTSLDVYTPRAIPPGSDRADRSLLVIGRLARGATGKGAQAELDAISRTLAARDPAVKNWTPWLIQPRAFDMSGDAQFLVVLAVAVTLVLLIVGANVAGLLLAGSAGRAREIATRLAMGAGRLRVARQLLTESMMLGLAGAGLGLLLSWCACRGLSLWIAGTSVGHLQLVLDRRVLFAACVVSLSLAAGVGVLPAVRLSRLPVCSALKEAEALWGRLSAGRLRRLLVGGQVAMAIVLLLSAGLVLRGLVNLRHTDAGFRAEGLLSLVATLPEGRYGEPDERTRFVEDLLDRLSSRRSFVSVAAGSLMPAVGGEAPVAPFAVEGSPANAVASPSANLLSVSPAYFQTMAIPVLRGRPFDRTDRAGGLPTVVVSQGLVERWMPGADPVGARLVVEGVPRTVVGVVGDVRTFHLNVAPRPAIYLPYAQRPTLTCWFFLRTAGSRDQVALAAEARREIRALDPEQPVRGGDWATSLVKRSMGGFDTSGLLVSVLAALAAGLAALGIYGVVAFSVARRTRELGIRMALGASPRTVVHQVMGEGIRIAAWASVPGVLLALAAGSLLASKLQGVSPFDPGLLVVVAALVIGTVVAASWGPARRAGRVDPVNATRTE
jgi:putative ABC transport system permease protein